MSKSFTGISFPFRIGVRGSVIMSTTSPQEIPHIVESVEQILRTRPYERVMEYKIRSEISGYVFDPRNASTLALIAYECQQAIEECDDRVEIISIEPYQDEDTSSIYVDVLIKVKKYEQTYSINVKVGDFSE